MAALASRANGAAHCAAVWGHDGDATALARFGVDDCHNTGPQVGDRATLRWRVPGRMDPLAVFVFDIGKSR